MRHPRYGSLPHWTIRDRFNRGQYWQRAEAGEFRIRKLSSFIPRKRIAGEPSKTRTQILEYLDRASGTRIALVHQYRRRDGSIGGSGRPDPKELLDGGILYIADPYL